MYKPKRALFHKESLDYPKGKLIYDMLRKDGINIEILKSNRVTQIPGKTAEQAYNEAKKTLVIAVRKTLKFQSCKPSAHYQLPLVTSCPGLCQYCYLQTTLGKKPYISVYVNTDEILAKAEDYINEKKEETIIFEGAATSDPLPLEHYTNNLAETIEFFGRQKRGRFRFVTKFDNVDELLNLKHNNHTEFRFSINTEKIISEYEHRTASAKRRVEAAKKVSKSGYPMGFLIAPIFLYPNWKKDYINLLESLAENLYDVPTLTFELIAHRFTKRAKQNILDVFPNTTLPLDEEERKLKYGQFGYTKYVYQKEQYGELEEFFKENITKLFPKAKILYIV
ncbi:spore photoproduct lyase [Proteinivorax hydrogeniformans]|uniref:Spore photoproduct lyase n=1 Tax=Proteinivorax hydrogeniformans TaxID=1826727 RepID=A0AAU8HWB4_9FIRM